jgi:hypothetical protein
LIALGIRLAFAGGRTGRLSTALAALAVAFGTAILLFALSFEPALQARFDRAGWRDTPGVEDLATATAGLIIERTHDHWNGLPLTRMDVAALGSNAPIPPGLQRLPSAGEAFVSPALATLIAANPPDQLGDRFGHVAGTMTAAGLVAPDELVVVVGHDPGDLRSVGARPEGARAVRSLDGTGEIPMPSNPLVGVLVAVAVIGALAPVVVFTAMASRLSAVRRGRRLAAMRLIGATPRQVEGLAAVESLVATVPGLIAGILLYFAVRPMVAQLPLLGASWFPESIAPPIGSAVVLLLAVPAAGAVSAVVALRRLVVSPLGVQRRQRPPALRIRRLLPLGASMAAFILAAMAFGQGARGSYVPAMIGIPFLGIVLAIAYAGPWLTAMIGAALVRTARGPSALLSGRRLLDEPASSFGAVAGVVLAVFVGSAFFGIASFARAAMASTSQLALRDGVLVSTYGDADKAEGTASRLRVTAGVEAVAVLREVAITTQQTAEGGEPDFAVVVECRSFIATLAAGDLSCGTGLEHLGPGGKPITVGSALTLGFLSDPAVLPVGVTREVHFAIPPERVDRYAPNEPAASSGRAPAVLIEPSALGAGIDGIRPTRLLVATDGSPAGIERARTVIESMMPTALVSTLDEQSADAAAPMNELARVVSLGVFGALLMAGASLTIAVTTSLVERRVPFALLRIAGMPLARIRMVVFLEAAAPLVVVSAVSALLGTIVIQMLLRAQASVVLPPPDLTGAALIGLAIVGALAVVAFALPLVGVLTGTSETRFE